MAKKFGLKTPKTCSLSWITVTILIGVTALAVYLYFNSTKSQSSVLNLEKFLDRKEKFNYDGVQNCESTSKPFSLMFFFMETCPHCVDFKPIWGKWKNQVENKLSKQLCITEVSAENDKLLEKYDVHSFPTVILVRNSSKSNPIVFHGERSVKGLNSFISENITH